MFQEQCNTETWESLVAERSLWRSALPSGAYIAEQQRQQQAEQKRQRQLRVFKLESQPCCHHSQVSNLGRGFHAQIGHTSHLRAHHGHTT